MTPPINPEIAGADRELLATTLRTTRRAILDRGASEQLLHGEPHPGNVLRTRDGLLFVDLETCCRGPVEFDIAHAAVNASGPPIEVGALLSRRRSIAGPRVLDPHAGHGHRVALRAG